MKSNLHCTIILTAFGLSTFAQPAIQWQSYYGGSKFDVSWDMCQSNDSGYVIVGWSNSNDGDVTAHHGSASYADMWILKVDSLGTKLWQKSYGGTLEDRAMAVTKTNDGKYIVAGHTESNDGNVTNFQGGSDAWILKLNSNNGSIIWQKCYGGSGAEDAMSVIPTNDGGCIVYGYSTSTDGDLTGIPYPGRGWIFKIDSASNIVWQKRYSDLGLGRISQTNDGGYVICDQDATPNPNLGYSIFKIDSLGNFQWQYNASSLYHEWSSNYIHLKDIAVVQANNGDYYALCSSNQCNDCEYDLTVIRLDSSGQFVWQNDYGGTLNDWGSALVKSNDGNLVLLGITTSNDGDVNGYQGGNGDAWLLKIDLNGNIVWATCMGGSGWEGGYSGPSGLSLINTNDNSFALACGTTGNGFVDYWVVKTSTDVVGINEISSSKNILSIYPNPSNGNFIIKFNTEIKNGELKMLNTLGENMIIEKIGNESKKEIQLKNISSGIYFAKVFDGEKFYCKKIIIE